MALYATRTYTAAEAKQATSRRRRFDLGISRSRGTVATTSTQHAWAGASGGSKRDEK